MMRDYVLRLHDPSRKKKPFGVAVIYASSEADAIDLLNREHPGWTVENIT